MGIRHAVITSVNRDELPDGGAEMFAETIRQTRMLNPGVTVEVLIPDFQGEKWALDIVLAERPDILNHNTETVPRLYRTVRPQAKYDRSLQVIRWSKEAGMVTKSGIMVGLGETPDEVLQVMGDLRAAGCDIMTIGQYLQPTKDHLPVARYVSLEEFLVYKRKGLELGFVQVESGPLVRSSYHAERHAPLSSLNREVR
jgi:lipoic acid synthetase